MTWFLTILGIVMLVVLHELGHFAAAKAVGMHVERFSLFFPPTLLKVKRGETEYAIGAIPAGGYVKIAGMNPEELGDMDPEASRRAYYNQPTWKRVFVILAGPAVNILIAFVLFTAILLVGNVNGAAVISRVSGIETTRPTVSSIKPASPAQGVLKAGDRIVTVEGEHASFEGVQEAIGRHGCAGAQVQGCRAATPVHLTIERGGQIRQIAVYPRYDASEKHPRVGFVFGAAPKPVGVAGASAASLAAMGGIVAETLSGLGRAFTSEKARRQVHSLLGITEVAHEDIAAGAGFGLVFLGFFSLALAILNLLPFLPLDGGHIAWSLAEKARGKRISLGAMYRYSSVGIILLLFLVINGFSNDISHLGG
ncbi:MAG TPA: M50 family metallopeptidase [Solirubrobacteraceae bacterium]|jgi:regulator of sigma E protease|nr:M50 family metallopeptidase [Solirubrobacteraceae bacterium]